ncbi:MAG: nitrogenase iron protein NifH [Vagococcus sp.]|uniref:nitrogenase iron protein NifH n=1 Tax=Vagococcus sp. TaxID=1933889 RepID=UPI002FCB7824
MTKKIAFYGKGGIGKSTVASNVSATLAKQGYRVLHIGCDPKADSVRTLVGKRVPTILQQIKEKGRDIKREDIVFDGVFGIQCVEAGGPTAGVGCAGIGITTMMKELTRLGVFEETWDFIVYDVLGDVVCGGFSLPMRKAYAEEIYIVSSSDFMSLYAANNIMKSLLHFDKSGETMGGIILNRYQDEMDEKIVSNYLEKVQATCTGRIHDSNFLKKADYQQKTIAQEYPDSLAAKEFEAICDFIKAPIKELIIQPLDEDALYDWRESLIKEEGLING